MPSGLLHSFIKSWQSVIFRVVQVGEDNFIVRRSKLQQNNKGRQVVNEQKIYTLYAFIVYNYKKCKVINCCLNGEHGRDK